MDEAGPEYVRVPQEEHAEFKLGNNVYRYLNRWAQAKWICDWNSNLART